MESSFATKRRRAVREAAPFAGILIFILGVAGILTPTIRSSGDPDLRAEAERHMEAIAQGFIRFHQDTGEWPSPGPARSGLPTCESSYLSGYRCLRERGLLAADEAGSYRAAAWRTAEDAEVQDPWGGCFRIYRFPPNAQGSGEEGAIFVVSPGPDGELDTAPGAIARGGSCGDDLVKVIFR